MLATFFIHKWVVILSPSIRLENFDNLAVSFEFDHLLENHGHTYVDLECAICLDILLGLIHVVNDN